MKRKILVALVVIALILTACKAVEPEPGAALSGSIKMGDKAKSASISLKVSEDGKWIESVGGDFTGITCEGFSAGSWSSFSSGYKAVIVDGKFEVKSSIGDVMGKFTSPTDAQGTIHILIKAGSSKAIDCGTFDWSVKK